MFGKILAALGLLACLALLLGMLLGRDRLQLWRAQARDAMRWRRQRTQARHEARKAIERARHGVKREGNVYRPKSFNGRPPHDDETP
jgi:hypothetical protein